VFGCKQSRSGSQALVFVCLQLLRQLGASQELPKPPRPGLSPRHGYPRAARPVEPPTARPGERAEGVLLLGPAEHNQTGGVSADGVLLQSQVTARVCSILWLGLHEGSGRPWGFESETLAGGRATPSSPGEHPGAGQCWHERQAAKPGSPVVRAPVGKEGGGCGGTDAA